MEMAFFPGKVRNFSSDFHSQTSEIHSPGIPDACQFPSIMETASVREQIQVLARTLHFACERNVLRIGLQRFRQHLLGDGVRLRDGVQQGERGAVAEQTEQTTAQPIHETVLDGY